MEHIVIRNLARNGVPKNEPSDRIGVRDVLTQDRTGHPYFRLGNDGRPLTVHEGDDIWLARSGYGVTGKARILKVLPVIELRTDADVSAAEGELYTLKPAYWNGVRDKVKEANKHGKAVYLNAFRTEITEQLDSGDHFLLGKSPGEQWSWMTLDTEEKQQRYLKHRGEPLIQGGFQEELAGDYGTISPKVKLAVNHVWKGKAWDPNDTDDALHYDHFVPRALGGPGIYPENVVITSAGLNSAKKHRIVGEFRSVALEWGLLSRAEHDTWGEFFAKGETFERQQLLCKRVTSVLRQRAVADQRRFYLEVLSRGTGQDVRARFVAAGIYAA